MIASFSHCTRWVPGPFSKTFQTNSVSLHKPENVMDASQIPVLSGLVIFDPQIPQVCLQSPIYMEKLDTTLGPLQMVPDGNKEEAYLLSFGFPRSCSFPSCACLNQWHSLPLLECSPILCWLRSGRTSGPTPKLSYHTRTEPRSTGRRSPD